jgi:hypothetical protein
MRQRAMSAAAALSGSIAAVCLGTALATGRWAPLGGFLTGVMAVAALVRGSRRRPADEVALRLCPRTGALMREDGDGKPALRPVGVTRDLICLTGSGPASGRLSVWRDSIAPDGFRRIAAYTLWRRSAASDPAQRFELIARKAVTEGQSAPRTGRPRGQ